MRRFAATSLLLLSACTSGPGRPPTYPDATLADDALPRDASPLPDAEAYDAAPPTDAHVVLPDAGPMPTSMFSGIFGILNDAQDKLYAREVDNKIDLIVTRFPYDYIGTIQNDGTVSSTSPELMRSGCPRARIRGHYERATGVYQLFHETCNAQGAVLSATITGGFLDNFGAWSGIYELTATIMSNLSGCYTGAQSVLVRYGFNLIGNGEIFIFTADDLISEPQFYDGAWSGNSFSAIWNISYPTPAPIQSTMTGQFSQATANDPVMFSGRRDVYDPSKMCSFSILLQGQRTVIP
jgi:hypothetical protein